MDSAASRHLLLLWRWRRSPRTACWVPPLLGVAPVSALQLSLLHGPPTCRMLPHLLPFRHRGHVSRLMQVWGQLQRQLGCRITHQPLLPP